MSATLWRWGATAGVCALSMWTLDPGLSRFLRGVDPQIVDFFRVITVAGEARWYLAGGPATALALWLIRRRLCEGRAARRLEAAICAALLLTAALAVSGLACDVVKVIVGRARPKLLDQVGLYGFFPPGFGADYRSFPSGHSNTFFVLALVAAHYCRSGRALFLAIAAFFASSRIMVNAHYFSDVVAGAALAFATTPSTLRRVSGILSKKLFNRRSATPPAQRSSL